MVSDSLILVSLTHFILIIAKIMVYSFFTLWSNLQNLPLSRKEKENTISKEDADRFRLITVAMKTLR